MIGNDIIDLDLANKESNWRRGGYLQKLFTLQEQELIKKSVKPDIIVWSLWSMKEAVYKADFKRTLNYEYAPLKVKCIRMEESKNFYKSELTYNGIKYFTFTKVLSDFIHTIACRCMEDFPKLRSIEIHDYPENYLAYLKVSNFISDNEWIIKNDFGVPNLIDFEKNNIYPLSISHHGRFFAAVSAPFYTF